MRGLAHLGDFAHWGSAELCWVWLGLACSRRYIACFAVVGGEFNLLLHFLLFPFFSEQFNQLLSCSLCCISDLGFFFSPFHHVIYAWNCLGKFKFSFGSLEEFDISFDFIYLFFSIGSCEMFDYIALSVSLLLVEMVMVIIFRRSLGLC